MNKSKIMILPISMMLAMILTLLIQLSQSGQVTLAQASACDATAGDLGGNIFRDYNANGATDTNEPGWTNSMTVTAYDNDGNAVTTTLNPDGSYNFANLFPSTITADDYIRLEFSGLPDWAKNGVSGGTSVQRHTGPSCDADMAVQVPDEYCQENPQMVTTCFSVGLSDGDLSADTALVNVDYGVITKTGVATIDQLGATWGVDYQRESQYTFATSFVKRYAGLSQGLGHIFMADPSGYLGSFDLAGVNGINVGTLDRSTDFNYQLTASGGGDIDLDAFSTVGTASFGDAEIYNEEILTVVNLHSKSLINIDISDVSLLPTDGSAISGALVTEYPLTFPDACPAGEMRPFGLHYREGKGYLGVVCDASTSQDRLDLMGYIYEYDPENVAGGLTQVYSFPFDYVREDKGTFGFTSVQESAWKPWANTWAEIDSHVVPGDTRQYIDHTSPIISGIEFTEDGSMVLGITDRVGHQMGNSAELPVIHPHTIDPRIEDINVGGDILKVCNVSGTFVMEGGAGCAVNDPNGTNGGNLDTDGPSGNGEFFWDEQFDRGDGLGHFETALGANVIKLGTGEVVSLNYDINNFSQPGGIHVFDTSTGTTDRSLLIAEQSTGFFKAIGLGDIELMCDAAPLEIGNYVWFDLDGDGIQDPGEDPIVGATVELLDPAGNVIGTATTDANGYYVFSNGTAPANPSSGGVYGISGLTYDTVGYQLQISESDPAVDAIADFSVTSTNSDASTDGDLRDNDATATGGLATISFDTGSPGENDHTYDFGFSALGAITGNVSADTDGDMVPDIDLQNVVLELLDSSGNPVLDSAGNPITTTTDANGDYLFDNVLPGDYQIAEQQPTGYNDQSEVDGGDDGDNPDNGITNNIPVTVDLGETDTGNDFVEELEPTAISFNSGSTSFRTSLLTVTMLIIALFVVTRFILLRNK